MGRRPCVYPTRNSFLKRERMKPGITLLTLAYLALVGSPSHAQGRSGFVDMSPAVQAMQRDDHQNPAMLWVADGQATWNAQCMQCHGDASKSMRGVAARYPKFSERLGKPLNLAAQVNECRVSKVGQAAWSQEHATLLGLTAFIGLQSRGLPMQPDQDSRMASTRALGKQLFTTRMGQLDLSCAHCHDERAGSRLGGSVIPQGHANGYPLYRLEWQTLGSLQRRLRNCMVGVRAEPFAAQAPEWTALEVYLAQRATGMQVEVPAVRP
jgi:L-cysteine S-thiosulfotransferase